MKLVVPRFALDVADGVGPYWKDGGRNAMAADPCERCNLAQNYPGSVKDLRNRLIGLSAGDR